MKAMILAAGLGTRLRPLTNATPKALILVNNQPLIFYTLKLLQKYGIKEVLINLHYLGELIEKELGDGRRFGMKISYSWEETLLGTGGGLKKGEPFFEGKTFFALNSDVLIDLDLKKLAQFHKRKKGTATMVVRPRADSAETPVFLGRADRIVRIGDSAAANSMSPAIDDEAFLYTDAQVLEPRLLNYLPSTGASCIIRQGYVPGLQAGEKVYGFRYDGYWNDLGTLDRYRQAESDLSLKKVRLSFLEN